MRRRIEHLLILILSSCILIAGCAVTADFSLSELPDEPNRPNTENGGIKPATPDSAPDNEKSDPDQIELTFQPLPIASQSPIQLVRSSLVPASPYLLPKGKVRSRIHSTWVNLWGFKQFSYVLDGEVLNSHVGLEFGLTDRIELGFDYNSVRVGGGILDSLIERFHEVFRFDDYDRPDFPSNEFLIEFYSKRGEKYIYHDDDRTPKERHRGASVTAKVCLCIEKDYFPETALYFNYKHGSMRSHMPDATDTDDYGFGILAGKRIKNWGLYFNAAEFHFRDNRFGSIRLRSVQRNLFFGAEYCTRPDFSIILQTLVISKAAVDFFDFSRPTTESVLGIRWAFSKDAVLEIGLLENLFEYFNSPDIGLHIGVSVDF
ncbi:MAG: DUF3187 family protein [Planctomycetota bacterium]